MLPLARLLSDHVIVHTINYYQLVLFFRRILPRPIILTPTSTPGAPSHIRNAPLDNIIDHLLW